jgi:hypothetical protein
MYNNEFFVQYGQYILYNIVYQIFYYSVLYKVLYCNIMYNIKYFYCTVLSIESHSIVHYCTIFKARTILYKTKSYIDACLVQYFVVLSNVIPRSVTEAVTLHESRSSGFGCKPHKPAQFSLRDKQCRFLLMVF